jgi:hypothetical protein
MLTGFEHVTLQKLAITYSMGLAHDKLVLETLGMFFKPVVPGQVKLTYADCALVLYI